MSHVQGNKLTLIDNESTKVVISIEAIRKYARKQGSMVQIPIPKLRECVLVRLVLACTVGSARRAGTGSPATAPTQATLAHPAAEVVDR